MILDPEGTSGTGWTACKGSERVAHNTGWSPDETGDEGEKGVETPLEGQPIFQLVQSLIEDGKAYIQTETDRHRLRARIVSAGARDAAIMVAVGLFLLIGTLVALLIGLILALAPHWGPLVSTALVIGIALVVTFALLMGARARMRGALRKAFPKGEDL